MQLQASEPLSMGDSVTFTLSGEVPTTFTFNAEGGEVLRLIAQSQHELQADEPDAVRDVVLWVVAPGGKQIAYADDTQTPPEGLLPTDAVIEKLIFSQAGEYLIYVDTYGGIFATEVMLTLEPADLFNAALTIEGDLTTIRAALPRSVPYRYTLNLTVGAVLTATVRDRSGTLDPLLYLLDDEENIIAMNDDHNTADLTLDVLDSRLSAVEVPADGTYTLMVTDFLGRAGQFELLIAISTHNSE